MRTGSIPENLFIVVTPEMEYDVSIDGNTFTYKPRPSFAVNADSDKLIATAKSWGTHDGYSKVCNEEDILYVNTVNEEFTNLQLIDLEKRSEGGTVYKVIDKNNYLYDLRDDVFLECLYAGEIANIDNKIYLTAKFTWAVNGSQMRIVRVGSKLYNELKEAGARRNLPTLKNKDLIPGTVYRMKNGEDRAFLGKKKGKGMLICDLSGQKSLSLQRRLEAMLQNSSVHWYLRYTKSQSFVESIGNIKIPQEIHDRLKG